MTSEEIQKLPLGLCRVYWDSGGSSIAAIGMGQDGTRWLAPTNWVAPTMDMPSLASQIKKIKIYKLKGQRK